MNRRSFFEIVTGAIAGVYAAFAPGKKSFAKSIEYEKVVECKNEDFTEYWPQKKDNVFKINKSPFEPLRNYVEPLTKGKAPPTCIILNDNFVYKLTVKTKPKTMNKVDIDKIVNLLKA